jgi:hypothetical protein
MRRPSQVLVPTPMLSYGVIAENLQIAHVVGFNETNIAGAE